MMIVRACLLAAALAAFGPATVLAQDRTPGDGATAAPPLVFSADAALASDYVFRGQDRSVDEPSASLGGDVSRGELYAGAWAADVRAAAGARTGAETDLYAGWRPNLYGFDLSVGGIYYGFIGQPGRLSFFEGYAKASRGLGPVTFAASAYLSPSYSGRTGLAAYLEGSASYALTPRLSLAAALGRQSIADAASYTTWTLGGAYALNDKLSLDLRYSDTDHGDGGHPYHARVIAALKAGF